jgi:hypothetical protein
MACLVKLTVAFFIILSCSSLVRSALWAGLQDQSSCRKLDLIACLGVVSLIAQWQHGLPGRADSSFFHNFLFSCS